MTRASVLAALAGALAAVAIVELATARRTARRPQRIARAARALARRLGAARGPRPAGSARASTRRDWTPAWGR